MKTLFSYKTACAIVAIAVSFSLMSFNEPTYVPAGMGDSRSAVLVNEVEDPADVAIIGALARATIRATRAAVNYTRITVEATRAYTPEIDRVLLTSSTYTVFAQLGAYDKEADKIVSKAIRTKMKALG